jgi:hypothetical protein
MPGLVLICCDCGLRATLAEAEADERAWRLYRDGIRCPDDALRQGDEGAIG